MKRHFGISVIFFFTINLIFPQSEFDQYYNKATVATFYSSTLLNPYYELNLALKYADSARQHLVKGDENYEADLFKINSLINELATSKNIAVDNLNYRIPSYSVITNNRNDINIIDDTEELLIEYLTEEHFDQADPLAKGTLNQNSHYFVININPFSETLLGVLLDFFSLNSGHYAIRPHELSAILGKDGFNRYKNDALSKNDFQNIFDHYKIDKLYNLTYNDRGSILEGLFYWGATLNTITIDSKEKEFKKYFEYFRVDKSSAFDASLIYLIVIILIIFLLLRLFDITSFKSFGITSFFQFDYLKNDLIIILSSMISVAICYYLGSLFSPDANSYYNELNAISWVVYQTVGFSTISLALLLLSTLKLSEIPSFSFENLRKVFFCSVGFPFAVLIVLNHFSGFNTRIDFLEGPLMLFLLLVPAWYAGGIMARFIRRSFRFIDIVNMGFILMSIFISQYSFLTEAYGLSNLSLGFLTLIVPLINSVKPTQVQEEFEVEEGDKALHFEFISKGFNYDEVRAEISSFFNDSINNLLVLKGATGSGKKTIVKKICNESDINVFHLNFAQNGSDLGVFKNCFIKNNDGLNLPYNFFNTPVSFDSLYKGIGSLSSILPVDIPSLIVSDDKDVNIKEIAAELINQMTRTKGEHCLIIENLAQITETDKVFFNEMISRFSLKSDSLNFKLVYVLNHFEQDDIAEDYLNDFSGRNIELTIECIELDKALNEIFSAFSFSNQLREFFIKKAFEIENKSEFSIGRFSTFFNRLVEDGFILVENDKFFLKTLPPVTIKLANSYNYLKETFVTLDANNKLILETASILGRSFSLDLLSTVLNYDSLQLIIHLNELENQNFVIDQTNVPGKYQFISNEFYQWIRMDHLGYSKEFKSQKIYETHNRIIQAVNESIELYDPKTVCDLAKNIIAYNSNEIINKESYGSFLLKVTRRILDENGTKRDVGFFMDKFIAFTNSVSLENLQLVLEILIIYQEQYGQLDEFEEITSTNKLLLDEIIDDFIISDNTALLVKLFETVLIDITIKQYGRRSKIENLTELFKRYNTLIEIIKSDKLSTDRINFQRLKIDFYGEHDNEYITKALDISKRAFQNQNFQLCQEIYRDLSLDFRNLNNHNEMIEMVYKSIVLFDRKPVAVDVPKDLSAAAIQSKIDKLFKLRLKNNDLINLSFSLNRFIDAYSLEKDSENVLLFCDYSIELNRKINDRRGLIHAYRHKGKALYDIGQNEESLQVYIAYYNYIAQEISLSRGLMSKDTGAAISINANDISFDFENELTPVIEGIIHNSIALNDFEVFNSIKKDLYKNNRIISHKILHNKLYWYEPSKTLSELLPNKKEGSSIVSSFSSFIFKGFLLLSYSDDEISEEEIHDVIEYVNAFTSSLEKETQFTVDDFKRESEEILSLGLAERKALFSSVCREVFALQTKDVYARYYNALIRLSYSDHKLFDEEVEYLTAAKNVLNE